MQDCPITDKSYSVKFWQRPWVIAVLTALFCLFGFPFFGYRLVGTIKRGLVVHILFWIANMACLLVAVFLLIFLLRRASPITLQHYGKLAFWSIMAIPPVGFLSTALFCVFDTISIASRHNHAQKD